MCLECPKPMGMQSKEIKDSAIKTGDGAVVGGKEGYYARLNNDTAWCVPNITGHAGCGEFNENMSVEVTFSSRFQVLAMALQGEGSYSYGEYIRILYGYQEEFYFHKIRGTEQVIFSYLSLYNGKNGKYFFKETKESVCIITCHLALTLKR